MAMTVQERLVLTALATDKTAVLARTGNDPHTLAKAILYQFEHQGNEVVVRAIGAGAVNQAVKGIAVARGLVAPRAMDLVCRVGFANFIGRDEEETTAMVFRLTLV